MVLEKGLVVGSEVNNSESLKKKIGSVLLQPSLRHRKIMELDFIFYYSHFRTILKGPQELHAALERLRPGGLSE